MLLIEINFIRKCVSVLTVWTFFIKHSFSKCDKMPARNQLNLFVKHILRIKYKYEVYVFSQATVLVAQLSVLRCDARWHRAHVHVHGRGARSARW